jgi:predicted Zn-dependent peptidase
VYLAVKAGASVETEELAGARDVLQEIFRYRLEQLLRGHRQYLDLSSALLVGRGLNLTTEWDYVSLRTLCPRSELRALLEVIAQVCFIEPLTEAMLTAGRRQVRAQWEQSQASPAEATYYLFRRAMLGDTPAAQPAIPGPQALARLTLPALQAFRDRY